jgi:hypothetical protein
MLERVYYYLFYTFDARMPNGVVKGSLDMHLEIRDQNSALGTP